MTSRAPVELRDARLLLRRPVLADVPLITAACQDAEMARWTTVPVPYAEQDARYFVETYAARGWTGGSPLVFAITDVSTGGYLGSIDLALDGAGAAEVGYAVAPWARGTGVCPGALRLLCRWGFDVLGLARIEWQAHVGNAASWRAAEKVGFTFEGTCRARLVQRGRRVDGWIGGLLPGKLRA